MDGKDIAEQAYNKGYARAVKDTAKKIYRGLCEKENWNEMKEAIRWGDESEELKVLIREILGVEVE